MFDTSPRRSTAHVPVVTSMRTWSAVITLALTVFVVTVTEMMPIGLLPQISAELHVSNGVAGQSVTIYGVIAGLCAPAMTSWTQRLDRRLLVLGILGVFVIGNTLTALVSTYPQLLAVRLVMGLVHGLMWSIVATVAARLVHAAAAAKATAVVFSGISLALVLGVPSGAVMGAWIGWQAAFAVLAAITALTWVAAFILIPDLSPQNLRQRRALRSLLSGRGGLGVILGVTAVIVIGNYAAYTYIAPFLILDRHVPPLSVGFFLVAYGVAGVIGNFIAGAAVTRAGSLRAVMFTGVMILTASLALLFLTPAGVGMTGMATVVWGMSYSALPVLLQTAILQIAVCAREAGTALYVMVFNVAIAVGSFLGAIGIDNAGSAAPILIGTAFCCVGACLTLVIRTPRQPVPGCPST